jgi:mono/diheme cytochrome c family protein
MLTGRRLAACAALIVAALFGAARPAACAALELEAKIPLGDVKGRIDHLAVDVARRRLFLAELGNDTIGVVDLKAGKPIATIGGQHEPQGLAYLPGADTLYAASGGDGMLRLYRGQALAPVGAIHIGDDADNVRIDPKGAEVLVGYGSGAIALVDVASERVVGEIKLKAHPESFRFDPAGARIYVNAPNAGQVAVLDPARKAQVAAWPIGLAAANFPMAVEPNGSVLIVTRLPARLIAMDPRDGKIAAQAATCGDSDDLFFDARRSLIYVSCGDGHIDVFAEKADALVRTDRIATTPGARTSLFVPEFDRLYVAVRASGPERATIWVFRPAGKTAQAASEPTPVAEVATGTLERGRELFADFGCGICHTLTRAGAAGDTGPSLDGDRGLTQAFIADRIAKGQGAMPAFANQLSRDDIAALASYVVEAAVK